jgi:ubiquinone/menaquinone biosynthesis C-methylase UbiE
MDEQKARFMAAQLRKPTGEEGIQMGEWMNRGNVLMNQQAIADLGADEGDKVMEAGMGNGLFVDLLLDSAKDIHYTGCDFSDVMVTEAERINAQWIAANKAKFVCGDLNALPFADDSFHKVYTVNTIYFWEEPNSVLKEIRRVLKPQGTLLIGMRPKRQMQHYPFTQYGFQLYSSDDVYSLLATNGYDNITIAENQEPDFDLNGEMVKMEHLIVKANVK